MDKDGPFLLLLTHCLYTVLWQLPSQNVFRWAHVLTTTHGKVKMIPITFLCENTKSD